MRPNAGLITVAPTAQVAETAILRGRGSIIISDYARVEDNTLFDTGDSERALIFLGRRSKVKFGAALRAYDGEIRIGMRSSIGEYSVLAGHGGISVGDGVIIAGHAYISAADHIFSGSAAVRFQGETAAGISIGDGAWLGAGCVVLDGVTVGGGCVVGAGSIVTRDLKNERLCFGTPCREVCRRRSTDVLS